jgi:hypothetical protein
MILQIIKKIQAGLSNFDFAGAGFGSYKLVILIAGLLAIPLVFVLHYFQKSLSELQAANTSLEQRLIQKEKEFQVIKLQLDKTLSEKPDQFLETIETTTSHSSNVEILDIFIPCILTILAFVSVSFFISFFFTAISNGKVLDSTNSFIRGTFDYFSGGNNKVMTEHFLFKYNDFQLLFTSRLDKTCSVMYRTSSDSLFAPFKDYLAHNKELLSQFNALKLQKVVENGNTDSTYGLVMRSFFENLKSNIAAQNSSIVNSNSDWVIEKICPDVILEGNNIDVAVESAVRLFDLNSLRQTEKIGHIIKSIVSDSSLVINTPEAELLSEVIEKTIV